MRSLSTLHVLSCVFTQLIDCHETFDVCCATIFCTAFVFLNSIMLVMWIWWRYWHYWIQDLQILCGDSFHSSGMCRMWQFLASLRIFFHSSLLCTFSYHPSPPTILPSPLTSAFHLFLGLPLSLVVPKFIYSTLLGILFSSVLCTCPNQRNLFNVILSVIVGFFNPYINFFIG